MIAYRIAKKEYATDLSGTGARLYGGRWNSEGKAMIYMASTRALAVLEVLVHLPPLLIPSNYYITEIELPDDRFIITDTKKLPLNWQDIAASPATRAVGDAFLSKGINLVMGVPSVIVPAEMNYLVNPAHPDIRKVKILNSQPFRFDDRLLS